MMLQYLYFEFLSSLKVKFYPQGVAEMHPGNFNFFFKPFTETPAGGLGTCADRAGPSGPACVVSSAGGRGRGVPVSPGRQLADSCWPFCLTRPAPPPQGVALWRRRAALMMSQHCACGLSSLPPRWLVSSLAAWPARGLSAFSRHRLPGAGGPGLRNGFSGTCQLAPVTLQYWSPRFLRGFMMSRGGVTSLPLNCFKSQKIGVCGVF